MAVLQPRDNQHPDIYQTTEAKHNHVEHEKNRSLYNVLLTNADNHTHQTTGRGAYLAEDLGLPVGELLGHGVGLLQQVEAGEVGRHVLHGLGAQGARVGRLAVGLVAVAVHRVPTAWQHLVVLDRVEQRLVADRAVPLQHLRQEGGREALVTVCSYFGE